MKTVLITGSQGYCGLHLASRLKMENGLRLIGVDRLPQQSGTVLDGYFKADVCSSEQMSSLVREIQPDWAFHLAGQTTGDGVYQTNVGGTLNLLEALRLESPDCRILLVGSAAEYGRIDSAALPVTEEYCCRPCGPYGVTKHVGTLLGQDYVRSAGLKIVVARPFNVVGPGIPPSLVVGAVLDRLKKALDQPDPVVRVGNVHTRRDFIAVEDLVDAYVRMLGGEHWGQVFNLCSGRPESVGSIVERLLSFAPCPVRLEVDPAFVRSTDVEIVYGSFEKARRAFGFAPRTELDAALRGAWDHAMRN